jgi:hypothetical protein
MEFELQTDEATAAGFAAFLSFCPDLLYKSLILMCKQS